MDSNTRNGVLKNGIQYIYQNSKNSLTCSIIIIIRYGGAFNKKSGLAHLIEHLVFKGTKKRPETKDLMYELDSLGGVHNAYTSKTSTAYHIKIPNHSLENGLDLLTDMIKNPKFLYISEKEFEEEFIQEKKIVQKELLSIKDNYSRYIHELIEKNMFDYPLDLNFIDDLDDLEGISIKDVLDAFKKYYCAENIYVSIYANLDEVQNKPIDIENLLEKYLGDIKNGTKNEFIFNEQKNPKSLKKVEVLSLEEIQNANLAISYQNDGYKHKKTYYMTELFSLILSDITSSRLFQSLREKQGLVYNVRSHNFCYDNVGYFSISTNTKPQNLTKVVSSICKELDLVLKDGVTEQELDLSKKNYLGKLILESENSMNIAEYNVYELFYNKSDFVSYSQIPKIINSITLEDMNYFIKDLLDKTSVLTVIKPK